MAVLAPIVRASVATATATKPLSFARVRSAKRRSCHRECIPPFRLGRRGRCSPMEIGSGCKAHLRADELPKGRLIVSVSGHLTAVIDGVIHDTHEPSRRGTRCV